MNYYKFLVINNSKPPENKYLDKIIDYMKSKSLNFSVVSSIQELNNSILNDNILGAISTGSDYRVSEGENIELSNYAMSNLKCPILGICYGFQAMSTFYGSKIDSDEEKCGNFKLSQYKEDFWMFRGLRLGEEKLKFCFHDYPSSLPLGFYKICEIDGKIAGIANDDYKRYGILFHPEEKYSTYSILDRFIDECLKKRNKLNYLINYESFSHSVKSPTNLHYYKIR